MNIIYGRNYTGKTTIARIIRCLENGSLHSQYPNGKFSVTFHNGNVITQDTLLTLEPSTKVRVYCTDFVDENLSWLRNSDGSIKPFTILGEKNVELDKKINEIINQLGSINAGKGLYYHLDLKNKELQAKKQQRNSKQAELDDKLRKKAVNIKNNATVFGESVYNINSIKADLNRITTSHLLNEEQKANYKKLLHEDTKLSIQRLPESRPNFSQYLVQTNNVISRRILPSETLTELINDSLLQEWVRTGINFHKNKRQTCGFCGSPLSPDLWTKLSMHFNKESEDLRSEIQELITKMEKAKTILGTFVTINKSNFYVSFQSKLEELIADWDSLSKKYAQSLDALIKVLKNREADIFNHFEPIEVEDISEEIQIAIKNFNIIIDEQNLKTQTLKEDQLGARISLRLAEIAEFNSVLDYKQQLSNITVLEGEEGPLEKECIRLSADCKKLLEEKRQLESEAQDESRGAELVNSYLSHYFGHDELKLVAEGEKASLKFKIVRGNDDAQNLSEGECSLISFCYFIARLQDEIKILNEQTTLIIYIDDPISSLDSNHIFFVFSLIESVIAKPKKYSQLFISTHNLEFLKYLKRLTKPDRFQYTNKEQKIDGLANFLIERKSKNASAINLTPKYLKEYITEFNYLFYQIYKCSLADEQTISHNFQYNFGNNVRKFLETFLFYKYPTHNMKIDQRLNKFFGEDVISVNLVNRVMNEYSHLEHGFERASEPIDLDSISKISKIIINKIKIDDLDQYLALVDSINDLESE